MIELGVYYLPGPPPLVARERARLECDCMVLVGVRVDRDPAEVATGAIPCSAEHGPLIESFNQALTRSLARPRACPLIDVVDELLVAAGAERNGGAA